MPKKKNRYSRLLEDIFKRHYHTGATEVVFDRSEIVDAAKRLRVALPKNLGDLLYTFRYRAELPDLINAQAPAGSKWVLRPAGRSRYKLELSKSPSILPSPVLAETKILDATPGIIGRYALNDEQALLARIRYNRLIDVFTGLTCYSLQNHLRTSVASMGQVETDELYVGIDKRGVHYVLPVQAKAKSDKIGIVQIEQDLALCASKFPGLVCRPIAAQLMNQGLIALFELEMGQQGIAVLSERHYRLAAPQDLSAEELREYRARPLD